MMPLRDWAALIASSSDQLGEQPVDTRLPWRQAEGEGDAQLARVEARVLRPLRRRRVGAARPRLDGLVRDPHRNARRPGPGDDVAGVTVPARLAGGGEMVG